MEGTIAGGATMAPDFNELQVFAKVVEAGGFAAAGRALGLPVSSVSRKVARLERRLGVPLLRRTTRSLGLTDAGLLYHRHLERALAEIGAAEAAMSGLHAARAGCCGSAHQSSSAGSCSRPRSAPSPRATPR
jgi:DNA-binding transcriptional LysR family regulator